MNKLNISIFLIMIVIGFTSFAQSESKQNKVIEFKYQSPKEHSNIVKFIVDGKIPDIKQFEKSANAIKGVSNFRVRNVEQQECIMEIENTTTADEFRAFLLKQDLDINKNYIKIFTKTYSSKY